MASRREICSVADLPPGERLITKVGSRSIGVFNIGGEYFALLNICPHKAAQLCRGTICGTNKDINIREDGYHYEYVLSGEILRCARHGWEFNIRTGQSLCDPKVSAKTYPVEVEGDKVFVVC